MPNRLVRDANGNLNPKNTVGGYVDGTVVNADIAVSSVQAEKLDYFKSTEITATGSNVDTAHGLGRTPALVLVIPTELTGIGSLVEGAHDSTNIKVTGVSGDKYVIVAL
jgi:hypothetical protein